MPKLKNIFLFTILTIMFSLLACNRSEEDNVYAFVGDSIITRWPLDETFPSQLVYNFGKSGEGIKYIIEQKNAFIGKDVVVMIGTNDYSIFYTQNLNDYASVYLDAISNLTDRRIYLYSVLPRKFQTDPFDINDKISEFNYKIKELIVNYPSIYYMDVYDDFLYHDDINYQYYSDGLHLNIFGYELLSLKLLDIIH